MSQAYWINDYEMLELTTVDGNDDVVAGIQEVAIEAEYQTIEELYTADSTERVAVKQAQKTVPISIGYSFFDGDFVEEWLGGDGAKSTEWEDTSDPQLFELEGDFRSKDGDRQIEVTVTDIYFESIPIFEGSMDEYVEWGLDGQGANITNFEESELVD